MVKDNSGVEIGTERIRLCRLRVNDLFVVLEGGPVYEVLSLEDITGWTSVARRPGIEPAFCSSRSIVYPVLKINGYLTRWGIAGSGGSPVTETDRVHPGAVEAILNEAGFSVGERQNEKRDAGKLPVWDNLVTEVWDFWLDSRLVKLPDYLRKALEHARQERWVEAADVVLANSNLCALPFEYGTKKKYSKGSWQRIENGFCRLKQAAGRHLLAMLRGEDVDPESELRHQAHLEWCIVVAGWYQKKSVELAA